MDSSGFVLVDSLFKPIYANNESIKILAYPNLALDPGVMDGILTQKILTFLPRDFAASGSFSTVQFQSGRRRYHCRAFILDGHWNAGSRETGVALLLERGMSGPPQAAKQKRMLAGMCEDPFSFVPNPKYHHFTRASHEVYRSLRNMILEKRGMGVLFAQSGMGKTALVGYLTESLRNECETAFFPGSFENRAELIRSVMAILGVPGLSRDLDENLRLFEGWLQSRRQSGRSVVLVCDDAQELDLETIQNLCLLSQFGGGQQKLLQIVFAGRQEFLAKLAELHLDPVRGKMNMFCRLTPMDDTEVRSYILHRLRIAGCNRQLFDSAAMSAIALYSRGIPLNVNMICRHCLSLAASIGLQTIDERIVADASYDLVLRTQPSGVWEDSTGVLSTGTVQPAVRRRDRHGLKLVQKP